jgi:hypothetical protein
MSERRMVMNNKGEDTFGEMLKWMEIAKFYNDGNKAAGGRARRAFDKIATLKIQWRKECLAK